MTNRQIQDQQNERLNNPGAFSPDDDEAQETDLTLASGMGQGGKRQAQQEEPEQITDGAANDESDLDDEDEDDDEEDGSGGHV
jgi:hypothetical protein